MPLTTDEKLLTLSHDIIEAFDKTNGGIHPGFRPGHAKGTLLRGIFTPSSEAASLTRAPHIHRNSTPLTVLRRNPNGDAVNNALLNKLEIDSPLKPGTPRTHAANVAGSNPADRLPLSE